MVRVISLVAAAALLLAAGLAKFFDHDRAVMLTVFFGATVMLAVIGGVFVVPRHGHSR
ncbi:hypothetical protein [Asanoa ferruginea]|uniref:hypothetical protein n=1 Tax=Asanoa ferruginea TaxID=53367 RepID=UPI001476C36E|nr:hypothetical protein [Asanoa ferruginea]